MSCRRAIPLFAVPLVALAAGPAGQGPAGPRFAISFPAARSPSPLDGRMLLMLSTDSTAEPRFQISDAPGTQLIFGIDVDGLRPGQEAIVDGGCSATRSRASPRCRRAAIACRRSSTGTRPSAAPTGAS